MTGTVVLRVGRLSRRTTRRALFVQLTLVLALIACTLAALTLGSRALTLDQLVEALIPGGDRINRMVVVEWRAPRAIAAALFGACLGVSGAVFQSLTRNPLGSPDIVGLNTGAYTGVVAMLMLGNTGYGAQAAGALAGGLGAAALIYLLAYRRGMGGFRLVIVGIAVSAMLSSVNVWFSVHVDLALAAEAAVWGAGSMHGIEWPVLLASAAIALPLMCALPWLAGPLRQLQLGDDTAAALGVPVERSKAGIVVVGVSLTALVTAVAGPIAFVALAAPPIAARITGRRGALDLVSAALVGAVLLSGADLIAQHALPHATLPVGAVTVCLGGAYLMWILFREGGRS
ncbi:FecCD family ABC transporter permease [Leucobacter chromiireducens]|uniref:Iron-enterobactin ABC transporter permease n=1 Tax=Leucobacter chromiireducens subsp. solipictus TaxID=398235 RepID=A0ABS1SBR4_9MICO|nr:iron chelate uptake ABC transporter family permease subunit [Leucobacter chromiireducens]MBL3677796.1 iron-enterobactin ABC transporter permease [Leucobacter chromiireducens subsp. solipictus]